MPKPMLMRDLFDFRRLRVRRDLLRLPLSPGDAARLAELEARFAGPEAQKVHERRRFTRADVELPAVVELGRERCPACIVNVGGGGVVVQADVCGCITPGDLMVVEVEEEASGRRLRFPAQAVWRTENVAEPTVGLAFVGLPTDAELARA